MQFLYPAFLWSLVALAIPIIIHLFHFRRFKKVYFTNVHLLKEIKEETSSRNKLRDLLILLARLLALAMLIFAFAQPFLKSNDTAISKKKAICIFVDNSFSMSSTKDEVPLMTIARDKAVNIINSYDEADEFMILTHDLEAKHQRFIDKKTAVGFVEQVVATPTVHELDHIMKLSKRQFDQKEDYSSIQYVISDFQANISDFIDPIDSTVAISLVPVRSVQESNIAIVDCRFEAPVAINNQSNALVVHFENNGNTDAEVQFSMLYQNQERPQGTVKIDANSEASKTIQIPVDGTGWHEFELIIDDYPIQFDDHFYGTFEIIDKINVLSINEGRNNEYLTSVFNDWNSYDLTQHGKNAIKYEAFKNQELIIIDDLLDLSSGLIAELKTYVATGGNLLIFPSNRANLKDYNLMLTGMAADRLEAFNTNEKAVAEINTSEFVFSNVFEQVKDNVRLPSTKGNYSFSNLQTISKDVLLSYRDGSPYLIKHSSSKGHVYTCAAPLSTDFNDLVNNAEVFVPMLYKMSISKNKGDQLYQTIGVDNLIELRNVDLKNVSGYVMIGSEEFIPAVVRSGTVNYIDVRDQIEKSGVYNLEREGSELAKIAFNYNSLESDVRYGKMEDIEATIGQNVNIIDDSAFADLSSFIQRQHKGVHLWRWFLMMALLFLFAETLLLRFWK